MLLLSLLLSGPISEPIRTYADGEVQEKWTWDGEKTDDHLVRKEWFNQDGQRTRLEEYEGGALHGQVKTWDNEGVLETEAGYADGQLHGMQRDWRGPDDDRWVELQQGWKHGEPDGAHIRRDTKECIGWHHNYADGELHGPQQAWHHCGSMRYDLNLVHGELEGDQRVWDYGDEPSTSMVFLDGVPHGKQLYRDGRKEEWDHGRRLDVRSTHDNGNPEYIDVHAMTVPPMDRNMGQELRLWPETDVIQKLEYWPDGTLKKLNDRGEAKDQLHFAENGQLILKTGPDDLNRVEWREDGSVHLVNEFTERRTGEVRYYDRKGRLRETRTMDYEVDARHVYIYEGDHLAEEGQMHRSAAYRWGEWTWTREDGTVWRTASYGSGPYSGNRSHIVEHIEYTDDGDVRCQGPEKEVVCTVEEDGLIHTLTAKPLGRPRHYIETWNEETFTFDPKEIEVELPEQAEIITVLGGPALVLSRTTRGPHGATLKEVAWRKDGTLETVIAYDGDTPDPIWGAIYDRAGKLSLVEEVHPGGAVCTHQFEVIDGQVHHKTTYVIDAETTYVPGLSRKHDKIISECPSTGDFGPMMNP